MTTEIATHRAGQAPRAPRNAGRHRPGSDVRDHNGRLTVAKPVPADWNPLAPWVRQQTAEPGTHIPAPDPLELTGRLNPEEVTAP